MVELFSPRLFPVRGCALTHYVHMSLDNLSILLAVAREGSFTRAASLLGVSPSALSQTIKSLETKLGVKLLSRTTRRVTTTEAGENLLLSIGPHLEEIENALRILSEPSDTPSGKVRLTATEFAAQSVLWPAIAAVLPRYPKIKVEIFVDFDLFSDRIDAGVRQGGSVEKGMIAVPISPPSRMAVVGAPKYFETQPKPLLPQDLTAHECINLRMTQRRDQYVWDFEKKKQKLNVRVEGRLVFNSSSLMLLAALDGFGLIYVDELQVEPYLQDGRLIRVLDDWCQPFPGYHLYYHSENQPTPAFAALIEALCYRRPKK